MKLKHHKTVLAAARHLGIHPSSLYLLVRTQKLPASKIGRAWHIPVEALDAYLREETVNGRIGDH